MTERPTRIALVRPPTGSPAHPAPCHVAPTGVATVPTLRRPGQRALDLAGAAVGLVLTAPLIAILALAVRLTSPGPPFYHGPRIGAGGRPFRMIKLRTMYPGADRDEGALLLRTPDDRLLFTKRIEDSRVTPLGRWLRRYSLDELPQLWNVLRGEMSLVGPRPEIPAIVACYGERERQRLCVAQGITGLWQVSHRADLDKARQIADDLAYVERRSLRLDLQILWRTLGAVLRGEGV